LQAGHFRLNKPDSRPHLAHFIQPSPHFDIDLARQSANSAECIAGDEWNGDTLAHRADVAQTSVCLLRAWLTRTNDAEGNTDIESVLLRDAA
jgi:hypothetical protein